MTTPEIVQATQEMIRADKPFVLATVDAGGVPQMRWMGAAMLDEPLTVFMAAGANSRKMDQMRAHPQSQLMFQDEDFTRVATLSGTCEVVGDIETKRRVWQGIPAAAHYHSAPEDPTFGVIKFVCRRVELLNIKESHTPAVVEL
ncbi:MAG: pyridoxamine 5'-phosphate oxidase family protein [Armatimonadota bacterium]|nr:MAG: pyridoxamine 5'-phosphate oxidase family protein [Armatimonadota bacterium]